MKISQDQLQRKLMLLDGFALFIGFFISLFFFFNAGLRIYKVVLNQNILPNIADPVSRFIVNVDFENRQVELNSAISKTNGADLKITLWRMGDGSTLVASDAEIIKKNESISYTYKSTGAYTIGYSIIDNNDLSDEAICVIKFVNPEEEAAKQANDSNYKKEKSSISESCGKSALDYNQNGGAESINAHKSQIRYALLLIGEAIIILIFMPTTSYLVKRFLIKKLQ
ncbi:MAG: hypothetical protein WCJ58_07260 [bacterium]